MAAALLLTCFASAAPANDAKRPNVLLISIDDMNNWVGYLEGHPQAFTPNLDRLAARGVAFRQAHCQSPVCTASRAALVTGLLPSTTGLYFLQPMLDGSEVTRDRTTLVEDFAERGYRTLGAGKVYGGQEKRFFQTYGGAFGSFGPVPDEHLNYTAEGGHPLWDWGAYPVEGPAAADGDVAEGIAKDDNATAGDTADDDAADETAAPASPDDLMPDVRIANWAARQLAELPNDESAEPFFLAVGFFRPHVPMYVPPKWFDSFPEEAMLLPVTRENDADDVPEYGRLLTIGYPAPRHAWMIENRQWDDAVRAYLACSTFVDAQVGRVIAALDVSPYRDNTIIVLFSDHGFHLGEKQRWAKRSLWQESTHVPLIFAGPGVTQGFCEAPVGLVDIYSTLLDVCGFDVPTDQNGRSLVRLLRDPLAEWDDRPALTTFGPGNHGVRSRRWRYIHYADGSGELYDHTVDPREWHNLAADSAQRGVIEEHRRFLPRDEAAPILTAESAGLTALLEAERARNSGAAK
jgi:arylsulfatase A-like enzyme